MDIQVPPPPALPKEARGENPNPSAGKDAPAQDDPLSGDSIASTGEWFDPSYSSYEILGLASVEPASRPPIIPYSEEMRGILAWASADCSNASVRLAPARPHRTLSAGFFDRLFMMAEAAKAGAPQTALAVLGVALDREALILSAEETDMSEEERERLLRTRPGNYAELATRLVPRLRPGNQGQQAPRASAPKRARGLHWVSKPRPPYVSGSFRSGGPGLLFAARGPRVEGPARAASTPGRWDRRVHVCSLAGVEGIGGTSSGGAVAAPWGALTMGEPCSNTQLGGKGRGEPRSSRRAPKARLCWGLCAAGGRTPLARLRHPEED